MTPEAEADFKKKEEALKADGVYVVGFRLLGLDRVIDNEWLVLSGLKDGDMLLLDGLARPGDLVTASQAAPKAGPKDEVEAQRRSPAPKKSGEVIPESGK